MVRGGYSATYIILFHSPLHCAAVIFILLLLLLFLLSKLEYINMNQYVHKLNRLKIVLHIPQQRAGHHLVWEILVLKFVIPVACTYGEPLCDEVGAWFIYWLSSLWVAVGDEQCNANFISISSKFEPKDHVRNIVLGWQAWDFAQYKCYIPRLWKKALPSL